MSSVRRTSTKSNTEFIQSLRTNFADHSASSEPHTNGDSKVKRASYQAWTKQVDDLLQVPAWDPANSGLAEEREQYDITAKLFFLPGASKDNRAAQTREALELVLKELHMPSIDLLILSFPGIYFDEKEDCPDKLSTRGPVEADPEPLEGQIEAWKNLEALKDEGLVQKLGISEFGKDRLEQLLEKVRIPPSVDQINLRDCCSVPRDLMALAKKHSLELLVHNDCSNILPRGTVRELLGSGPTGAGVLPEPTKTGDKRKSLHGEEGQKDDVAKGLEGDVQPQWVIKYTAVVRNRGVVENKGYFAVAEVTG